MFLRMTKKPHDSFSKQYLKGMLEPFGQEVKISLELLPGESQQVDVWFVPKSRQPVVELGMLGRMVVSPSLLEVFRNPIGDDDLFGCLEKLCKVRGELKRSARREKRKLAVADLPYLWLIVPTASAKTLAGCHAEPRSGWLDGFFFWGDTLRIGFVVIHQLPVVPETLLLRLLGRDAVQRQAVTELLQWQEQPQKTFIFDQIAKYQIMLKTSRTLSKEDQEVMVNIEPIYEAWANKKRQEGREEGREESDRSNIAGLLVAKFGAIDPELEAVIPQLIKMDPTERSRLILTLSREALLEFQTGD
jgi:hypothetical protein